MAKVLGLIPARGGSKGIPKKNIYPLLGRPLIYYTLAVARQSPLLDRVIVSTEDAEIKSICESFDVEVLDRPPEISGDRSTDLEFCQHALRSLSFNIVVILRPTCPFRTTTDIARAIALLDETKADSVRTVSRISKHPYWMYEMGEEYRGIPLLKEAPEKLWQIPRQLLPPVYVLNGMVDVTRAANLTKGNLYGNDMRILEIDASRSVDIDNFLDLALAEVLLQKRHHKIAN